MNLLPRSSVLVSLALGLASLSSTSAARAGSECKADADCGAGFYCEISAPPQAGCASFDGKPCAEPAPAPAPTSGFCREKPLTCTSDAQCPSYLGCVEQAGGDVICTAPACAPGEECPEPTCEQPPKPDSSKVCAPKIIECESDSACPTGFACNLSFGGGCSGADCGPDQECPAPTCEPSKKACGPTEIVCQADSECPADWRCLTFEESSCSGSGGTDVPPGGGTETPVPAPAPQPGSKPLDEAPACTSTTRNLCVPGGYLAGLESGGSPLGSVTSSESGNGDSSPRAPAYAGGDSKSDSPAYSAPRGSLANSGDASKSSSNSDDGCSNSGRGTGSGLLGAMLVGLAARLARRRR